MTRQFALTLIGLLTAVASLSAQAKEIRILPQQHQQIEGWGVSLCWWASMVGHWDDARIDSLITCLTDPQQQNMNIFRYNIGGGDDPSHTDGHMVKGKGKRAEMEGFKASEKSPYNWDADAGQRKILLKIKEKRPDAIFEAFSNSAPYWMTISGCAGGNNPANTDNLKPEYYEMFCDYLIDVCLHYKERYGITFKTLEPFNESTSDYWGYLGSQEGCHFDAESQIKLLRILYPKLKASGLNTVISASDETNLISAIRVAKAYTQAGDIWEKIGQFNTHTYSGTHPQRKELHEIMTEIQRPFWQSETGPSGGSGFESNLLLAQKLFDDMRYMKPAAWLDWQWMEEGNDTWCQVRCNFADQSYQVVKNFYVRMQVTRFMKQGYHIIESSDDCCLTAISPDKKEMVVCLLNTSGKDTPVCVNLSAFGSVAKKVSLYRTSQQENCKQLKDITARKQQIDYTMPAQSITTLIITGKKPLI